MTAATKFTHSVGYTRVSSRAQDLTMQRAALLRASSAREDTIGGWYEEKRSGKALARPELDRLRANARAGLFRRLYVYRLDRLTRSGIRDTFELVEELRRNGVEIVTVGDGFSLDGPAAEVVLAILAWSAKMERLTINERISAARERLAEEGRPWGHPPTVSPEQLAQAVALKAQGQSVRAIAAALGLPRSTIGGWLSGKVGAKPAATSL
jgi:DNA invertase Pin-like site-specific DNA recombinase